MRKRTLLCTLGLAGALLSPPSLAQAQADKPSVAEGEALTDKARQLYEEGLKAMVASRWAEAHASFLAAWRIKPHYQVASNLGAAELKLGKHRDAAEHLTWYLREGPATKVDERRRAEGLLKEALAKVDSVTVRVAPEGAEVLVDGAAVGTAPLLLPVFVDPGEHTFTARMEGWQTAKKSIVATAGGTEGIDLQLERVVTPPPAPLPTGSTTSVSAPPPTVVPVHEGGPRTELLITGGAISGAAAIAGVIFTVVANGKAADRDEQESWERCYDPGVQSGFPDCAKADELRRDAATFGNAAVWSFLGAGAIGAATIGYAVLASTRGGEHARGVQVAPLVAAGGGGVGISGQF
jgi:hypothetical protein